MEGMRNREDHGSNEGEEWEFTGIGLVETYWLHQPFCSQGTPKNNQAMFLSLYILHKYIVCFTSKSDFGS